MAFCGNCGFQNPDDARFCGNCGADLAQQQIEDEEPIVQQEEPIVQQEEPIVQQEVPSVAQPAAPPPPPIQQPAMPSVTPPPASPTQVVIQPGAPTPQQPHPIPPKSSGGSASKTCLGCGCAALIVFLLITGGACWWVYSYYKQHNKDIDEVLEWVDKNQAKWEEQNGVGDEDPETQTYNGQTLKELAEQQGFPSVTYSELPKEGPSYFYDDEEESIALRVNYLKFKEGDYIGVASISDRKGNVVSVARISPCGCSIYRLSFPQDESIEAYMFVYKAARRIIIGKEGDTKEFTLPDGDD